MTDTLFEDEKRKRKRKPDPELDALAGALFVACGADPDRMPKSERDTYYMNARQLKGIKATPEQVHVVANGIRNCPWAKKDPDAAVTPFSITRHWSKHVKGTAIDRRKRQRDEMDECFERVAKMERASVEVAIAKLKAEKPAAWGSYDYLDTQVGTDDGKRLCVRICNLLDAEARP